MSSFSQRYGYSGQLKEIAIREGSPESIRVVMLETASALGLKNIRGIVCRIFRAQPDSNNRSAANIWEEAQYLVYSSLEWFKIYDIIEAFHAALERQGSEVAFAQAINDCFLEEGIGWQLREGRIVTRGDEGFQNAVETAESQLRETKRPTAASHIHSALIALSQRPQANTPGAVAHATSAVESLLNSITGEALTLGTYLNRHPELFHPALRSALHGVYGYASDAGARHGREDRVPTFEEAQFAVTTCAAACTLLSATNRREGHL